jgi:hypothetical protein
MPFLFGLLSGALAVIAMSQSRPRSPKAAQAAPRRPQTVPASRKVNRLPAYYRISLN